MNLEESIKNIIKSAIRESLIGLPSLQGIGEDKSLAVSKEEVCQALNIESSTYKDYVRKGKIPYTKIGQKVIHPRQMFERWFNGLPDFREGDTA